VWRKLGEVFFSSGHGHKWQAELPAVYGNRPGGLKKNLASTQAQFRANSAVKPKPREKRSNNLQIDRRSFTGHLDAAFEMLKDVEQDHSEGPFKSEDPSAISAGASSMDLSKEMLENAIDNFGLKMKVNSPKKRLNLQGKPQKYSGEKQNFFPRFSRRVRGRRSAPRIIASKKNNRFSFLKLPSSLQRELLWTGFLLYLFVS